MKEHMHLVDKY